MGDVKTGVCDGLIIGGQQVCRWSRVALEVARSRAEKHGREKNTTRAQTQRKKQRAPLRKVRAWACGVHGKSIVKVQFSRIELAKNRPGAITNAANLDAPSIWDAPDAPIFSPNLAVPSTTGLRVSLFEKRLKME